MADRTPKSYRPISASLIQTKLEIGQPGDKYEQEADAVADQVMQMNTVHTKPQLAATPPIQPLMQPKPDRGDIQMKCEECEEESIQMKPSSEERSIVSGSDEDEDQDTSDFTPFIQAKRSIQQTSDGGKYASSDVSNRILASKGGGQSLLPSLASDMSSKIGADFSNVRIHTGSNAIQMSRDIGAQAFTHGSDIYFDHGKFNPASTSGKHLLAHELTHVVQQRGIGSTPQIQRSIYVEQLTAQSIEMSASLSQFTFRPPPDAVFREGNTQFQLLDMALIRLLGTNWRTGLAADVHQQYSERHHILYGSYPENSGSYTSAHTAEEGDRMHRFTIDTQILQVLLDVLRENYNLEAQLTANQMELIQLGVANQRLSRQIISLFKNDYGYDWYDEHIFDREMARNGSLLRAYSQATAIASTRTPEEIESIESQIIDRLLDAAQVYDMVREELPDVAPSSSIQISTFLGYIRTQQDIYEQAHYVEEEGVQARREMMSRYAVYLDRINSSFFGREEQLTDQPSPFTDIPIPARITTSPELGSDQVAATDAVYRFVMNLNFDHWTDAFHFNGLYSFIWSLHKLEPQQTDDEANATNRQSIPAMSQVLQARIDQLDENYEADSDNFEPAARLNRQLGGFTTRVGHAFNEATIPRSELMIPIPAAGHYIMKCTAMQAMEGETILRAPSQAFIRFVSTDIQDIAQADVQSTIDAEAEIGRIETQLREEDLTDEERTALTIQMALLRQMTTPVTDNLSQTRDQMQARLDAAFPDVRRRIAALEEEIELLQSSRRLSRNQQGRLETKQRELRQLQSALRSLLHLDPETSALQRQLSALNQIVTMQTDRRAEAGGRQWFPLRATFTTDDGRSMPLSIEYYTWTVEQNDDVTYKVFLSDLTTPNSGQSEHSDPGSGSSIGSAIADALVKLLENESNYGRGIVAFQMMDQVISRRVEAGTGRILEEAFEGLNMVATLAAIAAAPFTGGWSLYLLVPLGVIAAGNTLYRVYERYENHTLRMDSQTVMDIVDVIGGFLGLAEITVGLRAARVAQLAARAAQGGRAVEAAVAAQRYLRLVRMGNRLSVLGLGADGAGVLLLGAGVASQIMALNDPNMPEGEKRSRLLQILSGAFVNFGMMAGQHLVSGGGSDNNSRAHSLPESTHASQAEGLSSSSRPDTPERSTEPSGLADALDAPVPHRGEETTTSTRSGESPVIPIEQARTEVQVQELRNEMGDFAESVPLVQRDDLGNGVRIKFEGNRLVLEVGPLTQPRHVGYHYDTMQQMARYTGPMGMIWRMLSRVGELLGHPAYNRRGGEARMEVRKLRRIQAELQRMLTEIDARSERLNQSEDGVLARSQSERSDIQIELEGITEQLLRHQREVDSMEPGRGFVAAESTVPVPERGTTSADPLTSADGDLFYAPVPIGETRYYRDEGGRVGSAHRVSADRLILETELMGTTTTRGDYQGPAQPLGVTGSGLPVGGFEALHALGPIVGHENPQGIFFGPWRVNHEVQLEGIEQTLQDFGSRKDAGVSFTLRATVDRFTTSSIHPGVEFLQEIKYQVYASRNGSTPELVFEASIHVDQPDSPESSVDIDRPYESPNLDRYLTAPVSSTPSRRRQRVLQDIDRDAAVRFIDNVHGLIRNLRSVRTPPDKRTAAQSLATMLRDQLVNDLGTSRATQQRRLTEGYMDNLIETLNETVYPHYDFDQFRF